MYDFYSNKAAMFTFSKAGFVVVVVVVVLGLDSGPIP
jgi:low affinity Fe/Cu permease